MAGRPYRAGGILGTVEATRAASDAALRANLRRLAAEMLRQGTTTFECKSGYGLTVPDEARALALAAEVTPEVTYLGAHVVPPEFAADPAGYVDLVCGPMLDACAPSARWVDVFCEDGAFGADEAAAVLAAGQAAGLYARVHANQLGPGPGVRVAAEAGAASADHCTFLTDDDVDALTSTPVVATLLPAWSSAAGSRSRRRAGCSTRAPSWPWPPTATRAPRSPPACRSVSRSPCARWE
jgi:imidazolonepropionase